MSTPDTAIEHVGDRLREIVKWHTDSAITLDIADVRELLDCWHNQAVTIELYQSERGYDVLKELSPRIDKLYMALNGRGRGDENDMDGEKAEPWNRLVAALSTSLAIALANGRWAVLEHRRAEALIETAKVVAERMACDHMPRLGVEVDPECGRCEWMAPFRQALAEASKDAKADTKTDDEPGRAGEG